MVSFTYFAYGSNMLQERLKARCPSAKRIGVAFARGYALGFDKKGDDGSGKATIELTNDAGAVVIGVLFRIKDTELKKLDNAEGCPEHYTRNDDFLVARQNDGEGETVTTYIARDEKKEKGLPPYDWYKSLVVRGAEQNGLPYEYIAVLKQVACITDTVTDRAIRLDALAALNQSGLGVYMPTNGKVRIAGQHIVNEWKTLRRTLVPGGDKAPWKRAFSDFLLERLRTRYFGPIRMLQEGAARDGEGFSIVALQSA